MRRRGSARGNGCGERVWCFWGWAPGRPLLPGQACGDVWSRVGCAGSTGGWETPAAGGLGRCEGWLVGPGFGALGVAEPGFVAPEDVAPVGAAGLHAVFLDEVPDDLFEGDAAGGEVQTCEWLLAGVVARRGVHMQVTAGIARWRLALVVELKHRTRIVKVGASLVGERRIRCFKA